MIAFDFAHGNHRGRFGQAVCLADRSTHTAEEFGDMKIERGAARHQNVDTVAEDALDRVGNLALKVRPHDEVETLTGGMFDRESIFFAETAPTDFSSPVKEIALFLGHLAAHHQNLVVNALKDARHRTHIGWVDRVQVIGDMGYTARESQLCAGGKRMIVGRAAFKGV